MSSNSMLGILILSRLDPYLFGQIWILTLKELWQIAA
jgi:hypothetical protein